MPAQLALCSFMELRLPKAPGLLHLVVNTTTVTPILREVSRWPAHRPGTSGSRAWVHATPCVVWEGLLPCGPSCFLLGIHCLLSLCSIPAGRTDSTWKSSPLPSYFVRQPPSQPPSLLLHTQPVAPDDRQSNGTHGRPRTTHYLTSLSLGLGRIIKRR